MACERRPSAGTGKPVAAWLATNSEPGKCRPARIMRKVFQKTPLVLNVAYVSWGEDALWAPLGWQGEKRK